MGIGNGNRMPVDRWRKRNMDSGTGTELESKWAYDPLRKGWGRADAIIAPGLTMAQYCVQGAHMAFADMEAWERYKGLGRKLWDVHVLDFGSGTGRVGRVLSRMCKSVTCYEPSPRIHEMAQKECTPTEKMRLANLRFVNKLELGDGKEKGDNFDTGRYGYVVCHNVFEHLGMQDGTEAWEMLKKCLAWGAIARVDFNPSRNPYIWDDVDWVRSATMEGGITPERGLDAVVTHVIYLKGK
jgi:SAM-dependent methyltransferase